MARPRVRGAAYLAVIEYVVEHHGRAAFDRVLDSLTAEDRAEVERPIAREMWGPFSTWVRLVDACEHVLGTGDYALARAGSRWSAQRDLPKAFPELARSGSAADIVELSSQLWSWYYDEGRTEALAMLESDAVLFEVIGFPTPHAAHCNRVAGWLLGAFTVVGADVDITMPSCRALGDDRCLFLARGEAMREALRSRA